MFTLRSAGAAVLGALILVGLVAAPASADESKSVQIVSQGGRVVNFVVYLDPEVATSPDEELSSKVIVSGADVPSTATPIIEGQAPKQAVLVLDVSGSMRGPRLAAAKEAATNYVNGLPDDVEIGLVSFNDTVSVDVRPTVDRPRVIAAIDSLEAGKKTALYDGAIAGLDVADQTKGARLLVLSDGGDTVSAATVDDVKARAANDGVPIDIVALTPTTTHAEVLRGISSGSGGQFLLATDVTGLNQAFEEATGSFGGKVAVQATIPDDVDASGKFAIVTVIVNGTDYTGTSQLPKTEELASTTENAPVPIPTGGAATDDAAVAERAAEPASPWIYAVLVGLIVITGSLAIASYRRQQRSRLRVEQVLWYSSAMATGLADKRRPQLHEGGFIDSLDEWMSSKSFYEPIETKLDNSALTMNVATWLLIRFVAMLVLVLLVGVLIGNIWVGLVAGVLLGWFITGAWLGSRVNARRKAFEDELPDFLMLMASSLRSGLSFMQAVDSSAADGQGEVSRQMRRAISEVQMGSTIEAALMRVSERMESEDLRWTVTALAIQREVGGNLSNILDTAAATVKSRFELRREVKTLSAEGRLSGYVLAALPVGLFLYMVFANREYVQFFWQNTIGWVLLAFIAVIFTAGFFWVRQVVKIEV